MFLYKVKNVYYAPSGYWNAGTVNPDNYIFIVHKKIGKLVQTQREEKYVSAITWESNF